MVATDKYAGSEPVALFPLPGMVAFEGQQHLLHVFEPRYRGMVEDCLSEQRMLGLALPIKKISSVDNSGKSFQEILNSNQNTYEAHKVLGMGAVRILRTLPDGRILIVVHISHRVRVREIIQNIPYFLAYVDVEDSLVGDQRQARFCFESLLSASREILGDKYLLFEEKVPDAIFQDQDLQALMLKIMDWFRLDSTMLQMLLEERYIERRAARILELMHIYMEQDQPESYTPPTPSAPRSGPLGGDGDGVTGSAGDGHDQGAGKVIKVDFVHHHGVPNRPENPS